MSAIHPLFRASERSVQLRPDLRGRPVYDALGVKIGHVDDVLVEEQAAEDTGIRESGIFARYVEVGSGGRFHLRERRALVPITDLVIEEGGVRINASRFDLFGPDEPLPVLPKQFADGA